MQQRWDLNLVLAINDRQMELVRSLTDIGSTLTMEPTEQQTKRKIMMLDWPYTR